MLTIAGTLSDVACSLSELVQHGQNGYVFDDSTQLAQQLEVRTSL